MSDGTALNQATVAGGDVIATEELTVGETRGDPALPTTAYKIPRSKIAVGPIGGDAGDATPDNPLPVTDRSVRGMYEREQLSSLAKLDVNLTTRYRERLRVGDRLDLIDHRGPGGR